MEFFRQRPETFAADWPPRALLSPEPPVVFLAESWGPMGNTLIVGGLKSFSSKAEKEEQWKQIQARLDSALTDQISETIFPGSRGQTIIVRLKSVNKSIMTIGGRFWNGSKIFGRLRFAFATRKSLKIGLSMPLPQSLSHKESATPRLPLGEQQ